MECEILPSMHRPSMLATAALLVFVHSVASAQPSDDPRGRSRALFVEGVEALNDTRVRDALVLFQRAYELYPHYKTLYNIGLCQRSLGNFVAAAEAFQRFLDDGGDAIAADEKARVGALLAEVEGRLSMVTVQTNPAAVLTVDGRRASDPVVRLDPGEHVFEASAPGFVSRREAVTTRAGEKRTIDLAMVAVPAKPPAPEAPPVDSSLRNNIPFWIAAGLSATAAVTGIVCGAIALSDEHAYKDLATSDEEAARRRSRGQTLSVVADVSLLVALASGVTAVVIAARNTPQRALAIQPQIGRATLAAVVRYSF
jgi:tetratricopeptide (TPR) repeat protein